MLASDYSFLITNFIMFRKFVLYEGWILLRLIGKFFFNLVYSFSWETFYALLK